MTSERAAGESQLAPGSRSPSPFPVEPGVSEFAGGYRTLPGSRAADDGVGVKFPEASKDSAQPAASRPQEEARTNITAGSGGGSSVAPETSWVSAPGRREHNALAFLRRRWGYYGITERGYWVRLIAEPGRER